MHGAPAKRASLPLGLFARALHRISPMCALTPVGARSRGFRATGPPRIVACLAMCCILRSQLVARLDTPLWVGSTAAVATAGDRADLTPRDAAKKASKKARSKKAPPKENAEEYEEGDTLIKAETAATPVAKKKKASKKVSKKHTELQAEAESSVEETGSEAEKSAAPEGKVDPLPVEDDDWGDYEEPKKKPRRYGRIQDEEILPPCTRYQGKRYGVQFFVGDMVEVMREGRLTYARVARIPTDERPMDGSFVVKWDDNGDEWKCSYKDLRKPRNPEGVELPEWIEEWWPDEPPPTLAEEYEKEWTWVSDLRPGGRGGGMIPDPPEDHPYAQNRDDPYRPTEDLYKKLQKEWKKG